MLRREFIRIEGPMWVTFRPSQPCPECRKLRYKRKSISGGGRSVHSYNRKLVRPEDTERWSITTLREKLLKMGAKEAAGIDKPVSLHTLGHCFATHLLEQKVDIRVIQVLLGHSKLDTTARYSHLASTTLHAVKSPLDHLNPGPLPPA